MKIEIVEDASRSPPNEGRIPVRLTHQDQAVCGLVMPAPRRKPEYAVCIQNAGFGVSLEVRKLYVVVNDSDAEANGLIRVIDESGEDYIYPAELFQRLVLPGEVQRALQLAS